MPAKPRGGAEALQWAREAWAVFQKEMATEWRTRVALSGTLLFAVCSLTLLALSLQGDGGGRVRPGVAAALLWILILFTASVGLGRAFAQEEERGTALALRLSARATVVWTGKWGANVALLGLLVLVATPILLAMLQTKLANPALLFCVLVFGILGMASVFTTTGALVAQASARSGLLPALSFPVLVPLLLAGVHGTRAALGVGNAGGAFAPGAGDVQVLISYAVVATAASLLLFDFVWND